MKFTSIIFLSLPFIQSRSPADSNWQFGPCPTPPETVKNFDLEQYKGNWYEIYRDKDVWYELGDHCVTATWNCNPRNKIYSALGLTFYECGVSNKRYIS